MINIFDVPDKVLAFEVVIWSLALPKALPCSIRSRKIQIDVPLRRKWILILFFTVIILFYLMINIFDVPDKVLAFEVVIWSLALPKALPV
jgi:fumarate reductase subunit C